MKVLRASFSAALVLLAACAAKPTMKVNHAEVTGVQVGFPPQLAIQMTVVIEVHNPNSYDVAIRAMRGNVTYFDRITQPINFQPGGEGVWLPANQTTMVRVPVSIPVALAMQLTQQAAMGSVPYHVVGKADVTATRSLKVEKDDYEVDERGAIQRQVIEQSLSIMGIPLLGGQPPQQQPMMR